MIKKLVDIINWVPILGIEIALGIVCSLGSILLFVKVSTEILQTETAFVDIIFSQIIYSIRSPELTKVMMFVTNFGLDYALFGAGLIVVLLTLVKHKKEAFLFSVVLLMGLVINLSLKLLVQRPRPEMMPLIIESTYSYPSGHAMNSLVFFALIAFYMYHFSRNKKLSIAVAGGCGVMVGLVGFSRVYLGVHYPTDVLAGYVAGFWWFVTAILIEKSAVLMKLFKDRR